MDTVLERPQQKNTVLPMVIIGTLFFVFGFVTWLNGSLIPFLKLVCHLTESQAMWVTFAFYIAYVVMALPMSWVLNKVGYKNGMVAGLGIMAAGALLFIPAAQTTLYSSVSGCLIYTRHRFNHSANRFESLYRLYWSTRNSCDADQRHGAGE